jgi:hypothetical protein
LLEHRTTACAIGEPVIGLVTEKNVILILILKLVVTQEDYAPRLVGEDGSVAVISLLFFLFYTRWFLYRLVALCWAPTIYLLLLALVLLIGILNRYIGMVF